MTQAPRGFTTLTTGRERLNGVIDDAFAISSVVALAAGPGWGKTRTARNYTAQAAYEVLWLHWCPTGREGWSDLARDAALAASLLDWHASGDRVSREDCLLVIDGLGRTGMSAELRTALTQIREEGGGARVLMVGRRSPDLVALLEGLAIPAVGESELRLTMQELSHVAHELRDPYWHDGSELMRLTGGWMRGVLSMLRAESLTEPPPDDLFEYLKEQVFDPLPERLRVALARFSVIDRLDVGVARAIGGEQGAEAWSALRAHPLPLTAVTDTELILRPPFQAFLQTQISEVTSATPKALRMEYLDHMAANGRFGEAISWCMRMEDSHTALNLISERVGRFGGQPPAWDDFAAWTTGVGEKALLSNDEIAAALLRRLHDDDRGEEASSLARMLVDEGRTEAIIAAAEPEVRPILMLSLLRPTDDLMQFSRAARGVPGIQATSYMLAVMGGEIEVAEPAPTAWEDMEVVVRWGNFWQGRLSRVLDTADSSAIGYPRIDIPAVAAAAWAGDLGYAHELWEQLDARSKSHPLESFAGAALRIAEGDFDDARTIMDSAQEVARISTASFEHAVLRSLIRLLEGEPGYAVQELPQRIREMRTYRRLAIAEWATLVLAMAYARRGQYDEAAEVLDPVIASMTKAGRFLFLGAAMRLKAHILDATGDAAGVGTVLRELAERIPFDRRNPYWETLVADLCPVIGQDSVASSLAAVVTSTPAGEGPERGWPVKGEAVFDPFGWPAVLEVNGRRAELRRTKYAELLALLVRSGGRADRRKVLNQLFPEADRKRASNHLRQIIFKLRESTGIVLERAEPDFIVWPRALTLTGLDMEFETQVRAFVSADARDASRNREVLAMLERGKSAYLEGSDLDWVVERREQLSVLFEEAAVRVIDDALRLGDVETVRAFGQHALHLNPYAEELYQAMMEAELRFGSRPRGLALYRDAYTKLRELDLDPSPALRALALKLRDS
ncbi:BTAD domain-containing putative transcriptional regulator [Streptomyces sp. NPDC059766]|uniref:BTAD domain-containing putative transcriptional regulator n=1 Tax=Streptomyces sp. NPDC059766 TaxID=3346940 RepID=UPI0036698636